MTTHMRLETDEIPDAVARLAMPASQAQLREAAALLQRLDPPALLTAARGSSDHAATYLKYAVEIALGRPVASIGPSIATVHGARFRTSGLAGFAISQSGSSSDLVELTKVMEEARCPVLAITNTASSPLAEVASQVIDIQAGPERAVAATKSFFNSVAAGLWIVAFWSGDLALESALKRLPDVLSDGGNEQFEQTLRDLQDATRAVVIARGPGLGIAQETALKLIETCDIHASAYSAAEVLHGPNAMLKSGFPVVAITASGQEGMGQALSQLTRQGARMLLADAPAHTGHKLVDPLLAVPGIYRAIEALSRRRGFMPDAPDHLLKETKTL